MGILDEPDKFISKAIERGNPATAKVADKDCIAELAEIAGGPYYAPGRVEPRAMLKVSDVLARGREDLDKAIAVAGHIIVPSCILLGVGDEEASADVLYVEGREAGGGRLGAAVI